MQLPNIEGDLKSYYLIRRCSAAICLVTLVEFNPIRCDTMLCHFDQTRNSSVSTYFVLFSSTVKATT